MENFATFLENFATFLCQLVGLISHKANQTERRDIIFVILPNVCFYVLKKWSICISTTQIFTDICLYKLGLTHGSFVVLTMLSRFPSPFDFISFSSHIYIYMGACLLAAWFT